MKIKLPPPSFGEIKMTPMIDVIFLLLIFFICTADFNPPEKLLPAELPPQGASAAAEVILPEPLNLDTVRIRISFDQKPAWHIEDRVCTSSGEVQGLLQKIAAMKPDIPVILESEDRVPSEHVIDVYDICRRTGLVNIQFAAD
ncbi:MAG: biopolymer transporter ExbD [Planctomycetaceae bacterium]|jgi:biopolymer transport protein ExbD|nr:biopolymer transporter ExbD [Planctomycetaceae bacterium]